jgi:hypothetical protein
MLNNPSISGNGMLVEVANLDATPGVFSLAATNSSIVTAVTQIDPGGTASLTLESGSAWNMTCKRPGRKPSERSFNVSEGITPCHPCWASAPAGKARSDLL